MVLAEYLLACQRSEVSNSPLYKTIGKDTVAILCLAEEYALFNDCALCVGSTEVIDKELNDVEHVTILM